jgi:hypothetical protein
MHRLVKMRLSLDDLPAISVSRLRAMGVVTAATKSIRLSFAGEPGQDVAVVLRKFPNGGSWNFFVCPSCGRRARVLRRHEKIVCRTCARAQGLWPRAMLGDKGPSIERLIARLYGPPARLHPRPGRTLDRRAKLEQSLRRAIIRQREERLKGWKG